MDSVKEGILERLQLMRKKLNTEYKGVKPFNKEPVPDDVMLYIYENMAPQDLEYLRQTYGDEAVNLRLAEMEQLKRRRGNA